MKWIEQLDANGLTRFGITHPSSLKEMVWLLPKSRFVTLPVSQDGSITVTDPGPYSACAPVIRVRPALVHKFLQYDIK